MALRVVPIDRDQANEYISILHRHNGRLPSAKFCCAVIDTTGRVLGVAIAGKPKARGLNDGGTLEVSRVCSDGSRNVCSKLYAACIRAARALGYWRVVTYTLESEAGASLRACGWTLDGSIGARSWSSESGRIRQTNPLLDGVPKLRWSITLAERAPTLIWPDALDNGSIDMFAEEVS